VQKRSDARRNYAALLAAAEEVFAEYSPQAPLQLVAERAGVGRGTLYRHFPDRAALVTAIYTARIERHETFAAEHADDPDLLFKVLANVARDQMSIPGLFRIIDAESAADDVAELWTRTVDAFRVPLETSMAAGRARPDLDLRDLFLAISMLYGVANSPNTFDHDEAVAERALHILRQGLS